MRNIASIKLHASQAESSFAHHIAKALLNAGMKADYPAEYKIAGLSEVKSIAALWSGWLNVDFSKGEYYSDQLRSWSRDTRYGFITEASVERELNADSAFEMTVGRSSGYMVTLEMPECGERVFVSNYSAEAQTRDPKVTQWTTYYGGVFCKISAQKGSWVTVDGDGDPETFTPASEEPKRFRVGHKVRVGERVTV